MTTGATINRHNTMGELTMEYDVLALSRGPNIPCQGYKGMIGVTIK